MQHFFFMCMAVLYVSLGKWKIESVWVKGEKYGVKCVPV